MKTEMERTVISLILVLALVATTILATHRVDNSRVEHMLDNQLNQLNWLIRKKNIQIKSLEAHINDKQKQLDTIKVSLDEANRDLAAVKIDLQVAKASAQAATDAAKATTLEPIIAKQDSKKK